MLTIQESVARRPLPEAWVGTQIGVYGESAPHMEARCRAMERHYGVTGAGLDDFGLEAAEDLLARLWGALTRFWVCRS